MKQLTLPLLACLSLVYPGCSTADLPVAPVSGVVTMDGNPLANATVIFTPAGEGQAASGKTDGDGRYVLHTGKRPGAVVTSHRVAIWMDGDVQHADVEDQPATQSVFVPPRYNSASTLRFNVEASGTGDANFALTSSVAGTIDDGA